MICPYSFKNKFTRKILALTLVMGLILGLVGCGSTPQSTPTAVPLTKITVQLSWVHTVEFAGFYEAVEQGFYSQEGLEVTLNSGLDDKGEFQDPIQRVVEGKADFGIIGSDGLLAARAQGQPLVAVATIYQRTPIVITSLAENNILRPQDLIGKRVGIGLGDELIYQALLAAENIPADKITSVPMEASLDPLLKGEVDARTSFITNEPIALQQMGQKFNLILPSDYGVNLYSNVVFTTEDTIAKRPEIVEKFLRATFKQGYSEAVKNPEQAAKLSVARNSELVLANETASMQASLPLVNPAGSQPGMMDPKVWETAYQILQTQGVLKNPIDVNTAYTLNFINKVYGK